MNRQMRVITSLFLTILLAACGAPSSQTITEQDAGKTIEVSKGETITILLEGNPTTGYTWELASENLSILRQVGEPAFTPDSQAAGSGGKVSLKFEAVTTGQGLLQLVYHRSFEPDEPPVRTFEANVVVKE
jgi:inhibitor of cysteine peptidase